VLLLPLTSQSLKSQIEALRAEIEELKEDGTGCLELARNSDRAERGVEHPYFLTGTPLRLFCHQNR
jgi:hypothetical protein